MKPAFTFLELILIVLIIGIISVTASTRFQKDRLIPATNQVLDHIRYTQQLALNQDMFIPSPLFSAYMDSTRKEKDSRQWFKKWWQFQIHDDDNDYTIYSDAPTDKKTHYYDLQAVDGVDTIAKDPLTGEWIAGESSKVTEGFLRIGNLEKEYGVEITMSGCGRSRRIFFDGIGRPHCAKSGNDASNYPYSELRLSGDFITVTLTQIDNQEKKQICVTPITGYTYISAKKSCL